MTILSSTFAMPMPFAPTSGWRMHHVGIVVDHIESAAKAYSQVFGMHDATLPFHDQYQKVQVCFVRIGDQSCIELIEAADSESPVSKFQKQGGGLHHLAFEVPDMDAAVSRMVDNKCRPLGKKTIGFEGRDILFFLCPGAVSILIELLGLPSGST